MKQLFIITLIIMSLFACKKKKESETPAPSTTQSPATPQSTSGSLYIQLMQRCALYSDIYLANGSVVLYLNREDFDNNIAAGPAFTADKFGVINQKGLQSQVFYYKATGNIDNGNCKKTNATISSTLQILKGQTNSYTITLQ